MASNRILRSYNPVVELLEDAADGALTHGAAVGLKQNDEPALRTVLGALIGTAAGPGGVPPATPGAKATWNVAKAAKTAASAAARTARSNGRLLAQTCIGILKPRLGNQWTAHWQNAGITGGSLAVRDNPMTMLQQFGGYFATNPTTSQFRPDSWWRVSRAQIARGAISNERASEQDYCLAFALKMVRIGA